MFLSLPAACDTKATCSTCVWNLLAHLHFLLSVLFQDFCADLSVSSANFIPTVTAISTSPDLQWLVQPTLVSSVAPSQTRAPHPYGVPTPSTGAYSRTGLVKTMSGGRAQSIGRRGKVEQVSSERFWTWGWEAERRWGRGRRGRTLQRV